MVLTRGQLAGDSSSADSVQYPISTGNPMVAHTSNDAPGITVSTSGDALGSARKPVHGSQSGRLASTLTSTNQLGAHARLSMSTDEHQIAPATRYDGGPISSGPHTPDSDGASPTCFNTQGPSTLQPSTCLVHVTHTASGIQTNANTSAPQVPPALGPTFFGNYSSEAWASLGCPSLGPPDRESQQELCLRLRLVTTVHPCFTSKHPET